ncbi:hypothetical protein SNE40_016675 [Patella caerulea]|uniref:Glucosidase 2 subunit beta n=1 Tax=Patella caerulea TaxID=87958 RepID=A0AAN8JER8_PATCE
MLNSVLIVFTLLQLGSSENLSHPRGIPASKASFYRPAETFRCIQSGKTIPFEYINDDYCDCEDGSDEPGTSACPMMRYYCENLGHKPEYILSSRVNDGICDCCDGSDEFEGEKIQCLNFCEEIGRKDREEKEKEKKLQEEGSKIKLNYIQQGQKIREEKKARLDQVEKEKDEMTEIKSDLENKKTEAETPEKEAKERHEKAWEEEKAKRKAEKEKQTALIVFDEIDSNDDQHVEMGEIMAHSEFDIDADGTVSHDEAKEYLEELERVGRDDFIEKIWPNIKEIFKSKKSDSEAKGDKDSQSTEEKVPDLTPPVADDDEDDYDGDDDEEDVDKQRVSENQDVENKTPEEDEDKMPDYDEETKQLIAAADDARNQFNDADRKLRDAETEMNNLKSFLDLDFGHQDVYASLKGQCFEMTDREYTYKLCPFEKASQRPKSGGTETSLGVWGHWSGDETNKYSAMKYEKGQNCWNGPDRSAHVILQCGMENILLSASEPSRCEYQFEFATPAFCSQEDPNANKETHDEL